MLYTLKFILHKIKNFWYTFSKGKVVSYILLFKIYLCRISMGTKLAFCAFVYAFLMGCFARGFFSFQDSISRLGPFLLFYTIVISVTTIGLYILFHIPAFQKFYFMEYGESQVNKILPRFLLKRGAAAVLLFIVLFWTKKMHDLTINRELYREFLITHQAIWEQFFEDLEPILSETHTEWGKEPLSPKEDRSSTWELITLPKVQSLVQVLDEKVRMARLLVDEMRGQPFVDRVVASFKNASAIEFVTSIFVSTFVRSDL